MRKAVALHHEQEDDSTLSCREKEVLVCVAKGMINKEIADHLNISPLSGNFYKKSRIFRNNAYLCGPNLDVAQLVAHLVRDQEVEGSSPFIQTKR